MDQPRTTVHRRADKKLQLSSASPAALLALIVFLAGCGPTETEVGSAILIAAPGILLITTGILEGFTRLWPNKLVAINIETTPRPDLGVWSPVVVGAVLFALAFAAPQTLDQGQFELGFVAFLMVGSVYLTLAMILWRVGISFLSPEAAWQTQLLLAIAFFAPAAPLAFLGKSVEWLMSAYLVVAIGGIYASPLTGLLFTGFLIEAIYRRKRQNEAG